MTSRLTNQDILPKTQDSFSPIGPSAGQVPCIHYLNELVASLEKSRLAVLSSDLPILVLETARQRELCIAVSARFQAENDRCGFLRELRRVSRANRKYEAVLTRARRTVDIFCRVLATSTGTYELPQRAMPLGA